MQAFETTLIFLKKTNIFFVLIGVISFLLLSDKVTNLRRFSIQEIKVLTTLTEEKQLGCTSHG
jgi:hypothetical protein